MDLVTRAEAPVRTDSFRPVLGAAVVLFLALLAVAALKSYRDLASERAHQHLLERQIQETVARSEWLRQRIDRLHHDPGMLERLAREDLGMARPGDVIIELPEGAVAPLASRGPKPMAADFVGPPAPPPAVPAVALPASRPSGPPG